ncbi:MAG: LamG domain-containing protein, partial [Sedimentisphaerales bacterium]
MCRKLICLIAFVVLLGMASNASADLVAQWRLDEGSGTTVSDSSGNDIQGTFVGDPQWVAGKYGGALDFDGDDSVDFGTPPELVITGDISITCWVNPVGLTGEQGFAGLDAGYAFKGHGTGVRFTTPGILDHSSTNITLVAGEWQHVAATFSPDKAEGLIFYYNGVETERMTSSAMNAGTGPFQMGSNQWSETLTGMLDEVRVYSHILTESEILAAMEGGKGYPYAFAPDPADGAIHADTWVTLSWKSGDFAVSHDVYLGDNYDEVSEATTDSEVFRGNQADLFVVAGFPGFPYPDGLVPGTTYYWRIDEVNEADPNSPWKGPVWSFSVPPKTAYNPVPADGAEDVGPDNVTLTWTGGFGSKLHTVYFGDSYDAVNDATGGTPVGTANYKPGPLEPEKVYYWRIDEFDAVSTYKGDVWSFTTPGAVGGPQPAYDAKDVGMNVTLSWTPADSAASHQLYFGADKEAVRNADTSAPEYVGSKALGAETHDPGLLDADTSYYWRVD